jgi:hypothetical protein
MLIWARVFAISHAYIRWAGIRLVGSILTIGISITVEMDGDTSTVFAWELRTCTSYFCCRIAAMQLIFSEGAIADSITSILGGNTTSLTFEPLITNAVGWIADVFIFSQYLTQWT